MCSSLLFMSNTPEIVHYDAFGISYTISSGQQADPLFVQSGCTTTESFLADTSAGNTSHQLTAVENSQPTLSKRISQEMAREEVKKEGPTTTGPSLAVPQVLFWIQGCPCQPCMCFLDRTQDQVCNGSDSILEINASTRGAGPTASEEHALHALMKKEIPGGTTPPQRVNCIQALQFKVLNGIFEQKTKGRSTIQKNGVIVAAQGTSFAEPEVGQ
jgi:hypothetical protein